MNNMMNNEPPIGSSEQHHQHFNNNQELNNLNPVLALASQFRLTQHDTRLIIGIVQQNDPSIESLKQPKVQEIIKQRKGRWVQEEEDFANFLSEEFCLGLSPIDNGVSKRAYLSCKLACTKMRISKKFKGKNPGKEVFLRKDRTHDGREISQHEIRCYEHRHIQLEKRFIKAVLKSVMKSGVKNAHKKQAPPYLPPVQQDNNHTMQLPNASFAGGSAAGLSPTNGIVCPQNNAGALFNQGQQQQLNLHNHNNMQMMANFAPSGTMIAPMGGAPVATMSRPTSVGISPPASTGVQAPGVNIQGTTQLTSGVYISQPMAAPSNVPIMAAPILMNRASSVGMSPPASIGVQATPAVNIHQATKLTGFYGQPVAAPSTAQSGVNQLGVNLMTAMNAQAPCGQVMNHAQPMGAYIQSQAVQNPTQPHANQVNPMAAMTAQAPCGQVTNHIQSIGAYGQPAVPLSTPPSCANQQNPMAAMTAQAPCGQVTNHTQPIGAYGQPAVALSTPPSCANQQNPMSAMTAQAPCGQVAYGQSQAVQNPTPPCANQVNPMAAMTAQAPCGQVTNHVHVKPTGFCSQAQAVSTPTPPGGANLNPMPAPKMQVPSGIEIPTGFWGQPLAAPVLAGSNIQAPMLMSMQAPRSTEIQGLNNGYSQNNTPTFSENTVETERSIRSISHQAPAMTNNVQNTNGTIAAGGLKKRQITELLGSGGYGFPQMSDAGGGKRFKTIPAAAVSHAVSSSGSEPSSNDESDNAPSSNEASTCSRGISKRKDVTTKMPCIDNDMPDLLSGFDKHVASMKTNMVAAMAEGIKHRPIPEDSHFFAGAGTVGESPYVTSKSFDELHQFLGKGLSTEKMPQLDLNELNQSIALHQQMGNVGHKSTTGATAKQIGFHPSHGAFFPYVVRPPQRQNASHHHHFERQSPVSNSSDLTNSD